MLQVVSSGLQDRERLNAPIGKPSVNFYKSVMRRRTRWASQWRRVEFDNLADFGKTAIVTLPVNGELITRATLVVDLPDIYTPQINAINQQIEVPHHHVIGPYWAWTNSIGHAIVANVDFLIGGQVIDSFDSQLLEVLDEQTTPVEHFNSTDALIARDPSTFSDQQQIQAYNPFIMVQPQTNPQTLEIVIPFWWNRGPGPQALPIQALSKDKVQIRVTFRPVQQCVYTSTRINPANPPLSGNQGTGPLPNIAGCGFFIEDPSGVLIHDAGSTLNLVNQGVTNPFLGSVLPGVTMPSEYHFIDAYWIVEYVSLEDREATAFRLADLEIPIEQHVALPIIITGGSPRVRMRMDHGGLVRDLTWVAQRVEAPSYNAHFLFSKELSPTGYATPTNPCDIPWWPNAIIPNWDYGTGYLRPAFSDRGSDPIVAAKMMIRGLTRFEHEGPSIFRSLIPALNCRRTPLIDRYIYRYDFGFWATGGLAEANERPVDEIRGYANWDKLPKRELDLTLSQNSCGGFNWAVDDTQQTQVLTGPSFTNIDSLFSSTTDGLEVTIHGAHPSNPDGTPDIDNNNGDGAIIKGTIDWWQLRRQPGYIRLSSRVLHNGSASLVLQRTTGYEWVAVAGAGGYGIAESGSGGSAGNAVEIGWQGGNGARTHESLIFYGGGGGGRLAEAGVGQEDGIQMSTSPAFVTSYQSTGGATNNYLGGDGYYGGGSGTMCGGGGGSYVSSMISQIHSYVPSELQDAIVTLVPLKRVLETQPSYNLYAWITRYNRLRINSGRGGLMFNEAT